MGLRGEWHAGRCPGLSIRTLHAAPMTAAEATAAQPRPPQSVGRSVGASFVGSLRAHRQSAGGSVCHGLPRSHFVCSCRLDGGGAPAKTTTCVVPLSSPAPLPSSFLAQNERWIAVFSGADERSTKKGTRTRKGWTSEVYGKVAAALCEAKGN